MQQQQAYIQGTLVTITHRLPLPLTLEQVAHALSLMPEGVKAASSGDGRWNILRSSAEWCTETRWAR